MKTPSSAETIQPSDARLSRPLCVDLDGTVIATDLFSESGLRCIKAEPWLAAIVPLWLMQGLAPMKRRLAERVAIDPAWLPYHDDVVHFLGNERSAGREIIMVTAADEKYARDVARYLGIFSEVIASDGKTNVKGRLKLNAIRTSLGDQKFDYIGDCAPDLPVLAEATEGYLVRPSARMLARACKTGRIARVFGMQLSYAHGIWRALRVHRWAENLLLVIPMMLALKILDTQRLLWSLLAFLSFSLVASGVYILNDLFDLEYDRLHRRKRTRVFASGALPLWMGAILAIALTMIGFVLAILVPSLQFRESLAAYLVLGVLYCFVVRRLLVLDAILLASLYTLRILAGGPATAVPVPLWLLSLSMLLFFSLALARRYSNLQQATRPACEQR